MDEELSTPFVHAAVFEYQAQACIVHKGRVRRLRRLEPLPGLRILLTRVGNRDYLVSPALPSDYVPPKDPENDVEDEKVDNVELDHAVATLAHRVHAYSTRVDKQDVEIIEARKEIIQTRREIARIEKEKLDHCEAFVRTSRALRDENARLRDIIRKMRQGIEHDDSDDDFDDFDDDSPPGRPNHDSQHPQSHNGSDSSLPHTSSSPDSTEAPHSGSNGSKNFSTVSTAEHLASWCESRDLYVDVSEHEPIEYLIGRTAAYEGRIDVLSTLLQCGLDFSRPKVPTGGEELPSSLTESARLLEDPRFVHMVCMQAASEGHLSLLKWLHDEAKVNVNTMDEYGFEPYQLAITGGHLQVLQYFQSVGADLMRNRLRMYEVMRKACQSGYLSIVQWLVSIGGNIRERKWSRVKYRSTSRSAIPYNALLFKKTAYRVVNAYFEGDSEDEDEVEEEMDEEVEARERGRTFAHEAAYGAKFAIYEEEVAPCPGEADHLELLKWMVQQGVDVRAKSWDGTTVAHEAAASSHLPMLVWLSSQGVDVTAKKRDGTTTIHRAARTARLDIIKWLQSYGVDVRDKRTDGSSPAHDACLSPHPLPVLQYLHSCQVDMRGKRSDGASAVTLAPLDLTTYQWLHSIGVDIKSNPTRQEPSNAPMGPGTPGTNIALTITQSAARAGNIELLNWMQSIGTDLFEKSTDDESTIAQHAAAAGQVEVLRWLLVEQGHDISLPNRDGKTPAMEAARHGQINVLVWYADEWGVDLSAPSAEGKTLASEAAITGQLKVLKWLCEERQVDVVMDIFGSDKGQLKIERKNLKRISPVLAAAATGKVEILQWYKERHGVDLVQQHSVSGNLAHLAALGGHLKTLAYLKLQGFNFADKNQHGKTVADLAASKSHDRVVAWLAEQGFHARNKVKHRDSPSTASHPTSATLSTTPNHGNSHAHTNIGTSSASGSSQASNTSTSASTSSSTSSGTSAPASHSKRQIGGKRKRN